VIVDHVAHDRVGVVKFQQLAVLRFDLLDVPVGPYFKYVLSKWVKHLIEELTMAQLDKLNGQHRQRILFRNTIGAIPFGLERL
jgi:hypothetical protein